MRKLFALMFSAVTLGLGAQAPEEYCLSIEEHYVHPEDAGILAGFTTYRVYLNCVNETDFLSSCGGDSEYPFILNSSSETWYNSGFNTGWNADNLNPDLFGFFPELQFDSYLTIGRDGPGTTPELNTIWGSINPTSEFRPEPGSALSEPSFGSNFIVDDYQGGFWFTIFPDNGVADADINPAFAGEDLKILVMQITTEGTLSGQIYLQVFREGTQSSESEFRKLFVLGSCSNGECNDADDDGICDNTDDCMGEYDDCGVCNGLDFCELDESDFAEIMLTALSECGDDAIAPGLGESFELFLQSNGLLAAVTDAGNVIVGSWQVNDCGCYAELTFDALTCDPLVFEINPFGIAEQLSPVESCCVSINDLTEVWCSTTFLEELETQTVECAGDLPTECDPTILSLDTCATGDVLCELNASGGIGCDNDFVELTYAFVDLVSNTSTLYNQLWLVDDTIAPSFFHEEGEFDLAIEWSDAIYNCQHEFQLELPPPPCLSISDNCDCFDPFVPGCSEPQNPIGLVTVIETIAPVEGEPGFFEAQRIWVAQDGSGNEAFYSQNILITDSLNNYQVFEDVNGDGVCDGSEIFGCTFTAACNYDPSANTEDGSCIFICPGCTDEFACNFDDGAVQDDGTCLYPEDFGWCDCNQNVSDALGFCGGTCESDSDNDGICDDEDGCIGALDACGVCNGPGEIYDCGCVDIPEGDCDCDGNVLDACGICNGPGAIYECGCAGIPEGDCDCNGNIPDECGVCGGEGIPAGACDCDDNVIDQCGICGGDGTQCVGCTIEYACNYDAAVTVENNLLCEYGTCGGCLDANACNYNPTVGFDDGSCFYPENFGWCNCDGNQLDAAGVCGGDCIADVDEDGICDDVDDCIGSLDACGVCNGPGAIYDCGCGIPTGDCDCNGNQFDALGVCGGDCAEDADADGVCDDVDLCVGTLDVCGVCNGPGVVLECGCADIPEGDCDCNGNQLDECGVCGGDGAAYDCGCTDIPGGDCDCDGNILDALGECGGDCAADDDFDGICDDVDDCVGELDACGICNGPGEIYECGCADIPEGDYCDCDGNQEDALGVCGGDCDADADADGICDDEDECIGELDACGICNGPGAIYDCGCSNIPEGDCDCDGNHLDALGVCGGDCAADADADGICDDEDDCTDTTACNYDDPANESCAVADCAGVCGGENTCFCWNDFAAELIDFEVQCPEYLPQECDSTYGLDFDVSCTYNNELEYFCASSLSHDCSDGFFEGTYAVVDVSAGTSVYLTQRVEVNDTSAPIFDHAEAEFDYEIGLNDAPTVNCQLSLPLPCLNIVDNCDCFNPWYPGCSEPEFPSGTVSVTEVIDTLDGSPWLYSVQRIWTATDASGNSSTYHQAILIKDSLQAFEYFEDANANGICDFLEVQGCMDSSACNYDPSVSFNDGSCLVLDALGVCGGSCLEDDDNNGICDNQEIFGCGYELAENFSPSVTRDDGSCIFPCEGAVNINVFDWDEDYAVTVTDFLMMLSVYGDVDVDFDGVWDSGDLCVDTEACNYDVEPSEECAYIDVLGNCGGGCEADVDSDGICDDVDTCVGIEDECGVCNGPGPTEVVIESITILYDSVYLPQLDEWYVYEFGADTTFTYTCAPFFGDCGDPVSYQGYDYATVLIGEQCWFAENLRSENYDNGDAIAANLSDSDWQNTTSGAVAVYGEHAGCYNTSPDIDACNPAQSLNEYGRLYNWYAVDDARGLCPSGWHVPTDGEWTVLTDHLGGDSIAGGQMKTDYGWDGGGNGTNSSGFSGLPGGYRSVNGGFGIVGYDGFWWSSSPIGSTAWTRYLYDGNDVGRYNNNPHYGFSVRCVRDAE